MFIAVYRDKYEEGTTPENAVDNMMAAANFKIRDEDLEVYKIPEGARIKELSIVNFYPILESGDGFALRIGCFNPHTKANLERFAEALGAKVEHRNIYGYDEFNVIAPEWHEDWDVSGYWDIDEAFMYLREVQDNQSLLAVD